MAALVFDMDGTLTKSRQPISSEVVYALRQIKPMYKLHIVTGSDIHKVEEQLTVPLMLELFENVCCCNGTAVYHTNLDTDREDAPLQPMLIHRANLLDHYSQSDMNHITSELLKVVADTHTKYKTGTFIEWRGSQINFSIIGRNCSLEQREDYVEWDRNSNERERVIERLQTQFKGWGLSFSMGGQISIDITRQGWDKSYALNHIKTPAKDCIFFGDRIHPGGNDLEIAKACGKYYDVMSPEEIIPLLAQYS